MTTLHTTIFTNYIKQNNAHFIDSFRRNLFIFMALLTLLIVPDVYGKTETNTADSSTFRGRYIVNYKKEKDKGEITYCRMVYDTGWSVWMIEITKDQKTKDTDPVQYKGFMRENSSDRKMYFSQESTEEMVSLIDSLFIRKFVPVYTRTKNKCDDMISSHCVFLDVLVKCQNDYEYKDNFEISDTHGGYDYVYSPTCIRLLYMFYVGTELYLGPEHPGRSE